MTKSVQIRAAHAGDVPRLVVLAEHFLQGRYGAFLRFNAETLQQLAETLIAAPDTGVIVVAEQDDAIVGMLAMVCLPHPLSGDLSAEELAWWVEPAHRGGRIGPRLLQAAEAWACTRGAAVLRMAAPMGAEDVGRFLERRGYTPLEIGYVRRVAS